MNDIATIDYLNQTIKTVFKMKLSKISSESNVLLLAQVRNRLIELPSIVIAARAFPTHVILFSMCSRWFKLIVAKEADKSFLQRFYCQQKFWFWFGGFSVIGFSVFGACVLWLQRTSPKTLHVINSFDMSCGPLRRRRRMRRRRWCHRVWSVCVCVRCRFRSLSVAFSQWLRLKLTW